MLPGTSSRVPDQTDHEVNERIRRDTEMRVAYCATDPTALQARLDDLEREWDIERTLEVNGSVIGLTGLLLGATLGRKWLLLPGAVFGFCLQHALHGFCPPLPVFRRLGFRTQREIDEERYALKALRGDFDDLPKREALQGGEATRTVLQRMRD